MENTRPAPNPQAPSGPSSPSGDGAGRVELEAQVPVPVYAALNTAGAVVYVGTREDRRVMNRVLAHARRVGLLQHPVPIRLQQDVPAGEFRVVPGGSDNG